MAQHHQITPNIYRNERIVFEYSKPLGSYLYKASIQSNLVLKFLLYNNTFLSKLSFLNSSRIWWVLESYSSFQKKHKHLIWLDKQTMFGTCCTLHLHFENKLMESARTTYDQCLLQKKEKTLLYFNKHKMFFAK